MSRKIGQIETGGTVKGRYKLRVPIAGSIPLFLLGTVVYLFSATALGVLLGTVARSKLFAQTFEVIISLGMLVEKFKFGS